MTQATGRARFNDGPADIGKRPPTGEGSVVIHTMPAGHTLTKLPDGRTRLDPEGLTFPANYTYELRNIAAGEQQLVSHGAVVRTGDDTLSFAERVNARNREFWGNKR